LSFVFSPAPALNSYGPPASISLTLPISLLNSSNPGNTSETPRAVSRSAHQATSRKTPLHHPTSAQSLRIRHDAQTAFRISQTGSAGDRREFLYGKHAGSPRLDDSPAFFPSSST